MVLELIVILLFACYGFLVLYYWQTWRTIPPFVGSSRVPGTKISVIIPARDEEKNIGPLLQALENQAYPKELFEVIVIDDHSTDATATIVQRFPRVKLLSLKEDKINSYKKKAIETGIAAAGNDWIVTTDADCLPGSGWLQTLALFVEEKQPVFIAAPVTIHCNPFVLESFQAMDFMVLQAITGAVVYQKRMSMCNGANIAYLRKVFYEVNGFRDIDSIASGDDMLLMHKIWKQYPGKVNYLKSPEVVVSTQPMKSWRDLFNQRIRWASKARKYKDKRILPVLLLVYLFNLLFPALIIAGFYRHYYWLWLGGLWVAKTVVELPLFASAANFFNKRWALKLFFLFQPLHILYVILSGLLAQFGKYEWKGRKVK